MKPGIRTLVIFSLFAPWYYLMQCEISTLDVLVISQQVNTSTSQYSQVNNSISPQPPPTVNTQMNDTTLSASPFPLKPPYRIVQYGIPRSGSTFQTHLLHAIVSLKQPNSHIQFMVNSKNLEDDSSFLVKTHKFDDRLMQIAEQHDVSTFTSKSLVGTSDRDMIMNNFTYPVLYTQTKENLLNCSLCEVDHYSKIFGLTKKEVEDIKQYMKYYEIIRRCCGYQMSKYEMKRLNGCNMTKYRSLPSYPNCEAYNKTDIEILFANHPGGIMHHSLNPTFNWVEVGDCQRIDESIATGVGFNRRKFEGCDDNDD